MNSKNEASLISLRPIRMTPVAQPVEPKGARIPRTPSTAGLPSELHEEFLN